MVIIMNRFILNTYYDDDIFNFMDILKIFNNKKIYVYSLYSINNENFELVDNKGKKNLYILREFKHYDYLFNNCLWFVIYITSKDLNLSEISRKKDFLDKDDIYIDAINDELTINSYDYDLYIKIKDIINNEI